MADSKPTICMHCGHSTEQSRHLNRMADGRVCESCRDRLLENLPPMLPGCDYAQEAQDHAAEPQLAREPEDDQPPA